MCHFLIPFVYILNDISLDKIISRLIKNGQNLIKTLNKTCYCTTHIDLLSVHKMPDHILIPYPDKEIQNVSGKMGFQLRKGICNLITYSDVDCGKARAE